MPGGIDQSWGFADPDAAKAAGVQAVMMYLSPDPSKNATPAKIKAYHKRGIGVWLGWESTADRALSGCAAGTYDARQSVAQMEALYKAVGYAPNNMIEIYFAVDFDTNPSQYPAIDAYLHCAEVVLHSNGYGNAVYGEYDLVEHTMGKNETDAAWQAYAWSSGRISNKIAVYQYLNGQTLGGASVDFDRIIDLAKLGAWWPPGHPLDEGDNMTPDQVTNAVWNQHVMKLVGDSASAPADGRQMDTVIEFIWEQAKAANTNSAAAAAAVRALDAKVTAANDSSDVAAARADIAKLSKAVADLTALVQKGSAGGGMTPQQMADQLDITAKP
jgi:hypothetical protein